MIRALRRIKRLTYFQIAIELGCSVGTVRNACKEKTFKCPRPLS
jgi:DNA-directed RNA polymerase specialized sigma24 family protein